MRKFQIILLFSVMLCLLFPQASFAKDTKMTGKFAEVSGTVELQKAKGKKKFEAVRNMGFTQSDTISTKAKSKAVLHVDKNKEVTVSANTKLVVKQLVSSIDEKSDKASFYLVGGKVKVKINKKLQGDSKFEVQTPNAIMGVMGTEFDVAYDGENTYVGVSEGVVRADLPHLEEPIELRPDEFLQIDADGTAEVRAFGPTERQFFAEESNLAREAVIEQLAGPTDDEIRYDVVRLEETEYDDDDDDDSSDLGDYQRGYDDGYEYNFNAVDSDPRSHGYGMGYYGSTPSANYVDGQNEGYEAGLINGQYDEGYSKGYEQGYENGTNRAELENAGENSDYGSTSPTNSSEYNRGWSDGADDGIKDAVNQNLDEYNAGYEEGKNDIENASYDEGYADGEDDAYNEGWSDGYDDGTVKGYDDNKL